MTDDKLALAERVEAAEQSDQYAMLQEAFAAIRGPLQTRPRPGIVAHNPLWFRFKKMLDAEAYESAAMTLVPEGWGYTAACNPDAIDEHCWGLWNNEGEEQVNSGAATTPALALTAACLRALSTKETQHVG